MNDFPVDTTPSKQGSLGVRYLLDSSTSIFLAGSKKVERKVRYVELASTSGRYYLLVYKVKKNNTIPHFKIEISSTSTVGTSDQYSEFRFYIDNEDTATFDSEDSIVRNEWVDAINAVIGSLNGLTPTTPLRRNQSPARTGSRPLSPGARRTGSPAKTPSTERTRSPPITYAKSSIPAATDASAALKGRPFHEPTLSSQAPRSRGTLSVPSTNNTGKEDGSVPGIGLGAPTRRIQRHLDSPAALGTAAKAASASERDAPADNLSFALGSHSPSAGNSTPFQARSADSRTLLSPIASMSRAERSHGHSLGAPSSAADVVIGGEMTSPPRAPEVRPHHISSPASPSSEETPRDDKGPVPMAVLLSAAATAAAAPATKAGTEVDVSLADPRLDSLERQLALLQQENQALATMNDDLNEALERAESLIRSSEEDHLYQMAHMQAQLERAQEEPAQLKAELAEVQEEKESLAQSFADQSHELELNRSEIRQLKEELEVSQKIVLGLHDTISEYEVKYSARNIDRIVQLEQALDGTHKLLAERDAEVEELQNQLEAFRSMIREKEAQLRSGNDPLATKSAELSARRLVMQREIDELRHELERKDEEFVSDFGGAMEGQIKAKLSPLNASTKKLTMDLAAAHAAEEAQRVSRVRLESLVAQQEGYIEQLDQQVAGLRAELAKATEAAHELALYKDDARSAAQQREMALKERDELQRRVSSLERELATQREAFLAQLETAQSEIIKQKAQVNKVGIEDSHLQAEIAILNRRIELGKEQYLQLETQYHEAQRQLAMEGQHSAKKKESYLEALDQANQTVRELQSQCKSLEEVLAAEQTDARRRQLEHEEVVANLKRGSKEIATKNSALEEKVHKLELSLSSERASVTHLRELNDGLELKLQTTTEKLTATTEEIDALTARHHKQLAEVRQQLKESEAQRRAFSDREGASHRELSASLRAAEDTNRSLREDLANVAIERQNESKAVNDRFAAQLALQEKLERKHQELERLLSSGESERRIAEQHHAKREAELVTQIAELTTEKDALEVYMHKEKGEVARTQRALEDLQAELRSKAQFHEKLTKLHNEQVLVSAGLAEELQQAKRAHTEALRNANVEVDQLQLKIRALQAEHSEAQQTLQDRCQSLEDSLISTSQELKRTAQQLEEVRGQLQTSKAATVDLTKQLEQARNEELSSEEKLTVKAKECDELSHQLTEAVSTINIQREAIAELTEQIGQWEVADTDRAKELHAVKEHLREVEDQLRETLHKLEAAENEVHYLQNIAIPDLNSSALDTVERSKSEQARHAGEVEALQRSLEQREKTAKELHARIHQLEEAEMALSQTNASLALKMGEMIPIKDHTARIEAQRQATASEIAELSASKHAALAERDEAMNRVTVVVQDCRREAYALRRIASNMAVHAEADAAKKELTRGPLQSSFTGKPVADLFTAAEESGTELKEMVGLVAVYSEAVLRDFASMRTSCVHHWHTLQSELQRTQPTSDSSTGAAAASIVEDRGTAGGETGTPVRAESSAASKLRSPLPGGDSAYTIPASTLNDLLRETESMLTKLLGREKASTAKLTRKLEEELARRAQNEAKVADLQLRVESLDTQLTAAQSSKYSTDQRSAAEVQVLQQRINQLTADLTKRQDEYSEMIASLTKTHEEASARQATYLAAVMEQRIAEANMKAKARVEEVEQRLRQTETTLHGELEELKRDYTRQVEQCQRLERDFAKRDSEASAALARFDTIQAELDDKAYQLENTLSQLEKAELKAAKEARLRLELERTLRRLKNPGALASTSNLLDGPDNGAELDGISHARPPTSVNSRLSSQRSTNAIKPNGAASGTKAMTRERPSHLDVSSNDLASVASANVSFIAAEEFDPARDLPSTIYHRTAANSANTPLLRSALMRSAAGTPESVTRERRFFASDSATANSSVASAQQTREQRSAGRSFAVGNSASSGRLTQVPETHEMGDRVYMPSATSTIRSNLSSPDQSPDPPKTFAHGPGSMRSIQRTLESATPGANKSSSAFERAFQATFRIEEAMKAKGWKLST